jgi:alkanesulfonate monooxygenase SsuD/methylene tetrahydromethanopterin reductase-like flavin-dependent oxidoreductase (luciferase family)
VIVEANRQRHVVGPPEQVVPALLALAAEAGADELMVTTMVYGAEERRRSYELLAGAWRA